MNIYVGNLSYDVSDDNLREVFEAYGQVSSAKVITDKYSGRSKGFGFVEMDNDAEGNAAIEQLDGAEIDGRSIKVNEARPREERPRRDNFRGGNGGGGGRRY
ncbi:MAG: RNA-binding protein [Balneolaceae bacterium]